MLLFVGIKTEKKFMLYFIGDVHGELEHLADKLAFKNIRDSQLVQVGDFGFGFFGSKEREDQSIKTLNKTLTASNNLLYVIRGNHDDPSYFEKWQKIGNIRIVPDYSVLELNGYSVLLIGGAISIDRTSRVLGKSYWKEEEFVFDQDRLESVMKDLKKLDIVVTHNAPLEFWPFEFNNLVRAYARRDENLLTDLNDEREKHSKLLKRVTSRLTPTHWYYGHFHTIEDNQYNEIKYFALGESEIREHVC
ncbi:MAG: metallophosphoesterase [Bacteroidetes bacterium]|nr:metallophosphoesterase [Bacteroidota bacterium]